MKVPIHGDAAVVTYATSDKGKYKTQDISGRCRWTDVFVRRAGTWQIVAGQGTPIQQPKPQRDSGTIFSRMNADRPSLLAVVWSMKREVDLRAREHRG